MHTEKDQLSSFHQEQMERDDIKAFLEHITECDDCMERMIAHEEKNSIPAPVYLKEQIIKRSQMPDMIVVKQVQKTSKQLQLFLFGCKTAAAVVGALLLLFTVTRFDEVGIMQGDQLSVLAAGMEQQGDRAAQWFDEYSNWMINGGIRSEKTKK